MASLLPPPLPTHLSAGCNGKCPKLWRLYLGHYYAHQRKTNQGLQLAEMTFSSNFKRLQYFQLIFNNGCQQAQHSDFLFTSLRIKPTSFQKWNNLWPFKLNSHPPSSWYCRELCSRVQLWFIFWHYRFFSGPRPSFLFTLCSRASVRSDTEREREI